jgi:hypothetical protein
MRSSGKEERDEEEAMSARREEEGCLLGGVGVGVSKVVFEFSGR